MAEAPQEEQQVQVPIDDSGTLSCYANFCRVSGTPEEVILDLGLNPHSTPVPSDPVVIEQRVIMNYYTAKRMLGALHMAVQRHEAAFGTLETDFRKRLVQQPAEEAGK